MGSLTKGLSSSLTETAWPKGASQGEGPEGAGAGIAAGPAVHRVMPHMQHLSAKRGHESYHEHQGHDLLRQLPLGQFYGLDLQSHQLLRQRLTSRCLKDFFFPIPGGQPLVSTYRFQVNDHRSRALDPASRILLDSPCWSIASPPLVHC